MNRVERNIDYLDVTDNCGIKGAYILGKKDWKSWTGPI
jgi:hypothetical protein